MDQVIGRWKHRSRLGFQSLVDKGMNEYWLTLALERWKYRNKGMKNALLCSDAVGGREACSNRDQKSSRLQNVGKRWQEMQHCGENKEIRLL